MLNVPNALTLLRLALVPVIGVLLWRGDAGTALLLFLVAALSDFADGQIARRWNLQTRFGAVADPLADKLTMLTVALLLTMQQALPWWFTAALVLRDLVIVGGALAFHWTVGHVEMEPTRLSKLNTGLQFLLLLCALAVAAGHVPDGAWFDALLWSTLATTLLSGVQYVLVWSRKAAQQRRRAA